MCNGRDIGTNLSDRTGERCREREKQGQMSGRRKRTEGDLQETKLNHVLSFHTVKAVRFPIKSLESQPNPK